MKKKTHNRTSGPWRFLKRGWMARGPLVVGSGHRVVADCDVDDAEGTYRRIENVANAKFIAQSPQMLSLLKKAHLLLDGSNLALEIDGRIWDKEVWMDEYSKLTNKIKDVD